MKLMMIVEGIGKPYIPGTLPHKITPLKASAPPRNTDRKPSSFDKKDRLTRRAQKQYEESKKTKYERAPVYLVKEIMASPVFFLNPQDTLDKAWDLMCQKRFRHVPISPDGKKIVGILSDRDLLRQAPDITRDSRNKIGTAKKKTIDAIMTRAVLTAFPNAEIRHIAKILFEERIGCLPIIDSQETLVGIITRSDILRLITNQVPFELWC